MMCQACENGEHWNCGMQTWCQCDCGGPDDFDVPYDPTIDDLAECFRCNPIAPAWVQAVEGVSQQEVRERMAAAGETVDPFIGL